MGTRSVVCFNKPVQGDPTSFTFDNSTPPIVTDLRTVFDAQAEALVRVGQQFDTILAAGRTVGAKTYQIDDASRTAMLSTWNNNVWPVTWIAADNTTISLTQAQFQTGALNILQYYNAMVLNRRTHKNNIAALATVAACDAYDVTTGWPP